MLPYRLNQLKKKPRTVSGRGKKKRQGPDSPALGVGYSGLIVLNAADRRRDWHPGGGSCDMCQFFIFHQTDPLFKLKLIF
jgi:hypothetical protein